MIKNISDPSHQFTLCYSLVRHQLSRDDLPAKPEPYQRRWSRQVTIYQSCNLILNRVSWVISNQDRNMDVVQFFQSALDRGYKKGTFLQAVFTAHIAFFDLLLQDWRWFPLWIERRLQFYESLISEANPSLGLEVLAELLLQIQWSHTVLKANMTVVMSTDAFFMEQLNARQPDRPSSYTVTGKFREEEVTETFRPEIKALLDGIEYNCARLTAYETRIRQLMENVRVSFYSELQGQVILTEFRLDYCKAMRCCTGQGINSSWDFCLKIS
jgi:hypothetical protein